MRASQGCDGHGLNSYTVTVKPSIAWDDRAELTLSGRLVVPDVVACTGLTRVASLSGR